MVERPTAAREATSTTLTYTFLQTIASMTVTVHSHWSKHDCCRFEMVTVTHTTVTCDKTRTQCVGNSSTVGAEGEVGQRTPAPRRPPAAASTDCSSRPSPASGRGFDQRTAERRRVRAEGVAGEAAGRTGERQTDHTYQLAAAAAVERRTHCRTMSAVVRAAQASGQPTPGACLR